MHEHFLYRFEYAKQIGISIRFVHKKSAHVVANAPSLAAHNLGKPLAALYRLRLSREKISERIGKLAKCFGLGDNFPALNRGDANRLPVARAVSKKAKFEIVGQDEIGIAEVAFHLLRFFCLIEVYADILGFRIATRDIAAQKDEVRVAVLASRWIVENLEFGVECMDEGLKRGTIRMLTSLACLELLLDTGDICFYRLLGHVPHYAVFHEPRHLWVPCHC